MLNDFMNCRMRISFRLAGTAHRKNSVVTSRKGSSRPLGISESSISSCCEGLRSGLIEPVEMLKVCSLSSNEMRLQSRASEDVHLRRISRLPVNRSILSTQSVYPMANSGRHSRAEPIRGAMKDSLTAPYPATSRYARANSPQSSPAFLPPQSVRRLRRPPAPGRSPSPRI